MPTEFSKFMFCLFSICSVASSAVAVIIFAESNAITLGWVTSPIAPFGPSTFDQCNAAAVGPGESVMLAGSHDPAVGLDDRFAALQLIPNAMGGVELGWATAISGPFGSSEGDSARAVAIYPDGRTILAGIYNPLGPDPARFAALQLIPNMSGGVDLGWATALSEPFGPSEGSGDRVNSMVIDASGAIILVGSHNPVGIAEPERFAALQLIPNMSGGVNLGWATALVEPFGPSDLDVARAVTIDSDGNIILAGTHNPSGGVTRFAALQLIPDGSGNVDLGWATAVSGPFGPFELDRANGVAIDGNNTVILAGFHELSGPSMFAALQLIPNMSGGVDLGWATAISEPFGPSQLDVANDIVINEDGEIILGGFHDPSGSNPTVFAALQLKPSNGGVTLGWATAPGPVFGPTTFDVAFSVVLEGGNTVLAGTHFSPSEARFAALQLTQPASALTRLFRMSFVPMAAT